MGIRECLVVIKILYFVAHTFTSFFNDVAAVVARGTMVVLCSAGWGYTGLAVRLTLTSFRAARPSSQWRA